MRTGGSSTRDCSATILRRRRDDERVSGSRPLVGSILSTLRPIQGPPRVLWGLGKDHGWVGHNGETPGYNTYLFYHPELDAVVVEVNSDISSGKCPKDVPIMNEWPRAIPCELPADRIFEALAEALGKPSPSPPE